MQSATRSLLRVAPWALVAVMTVGCNSLAEHGPPGGAVEVAVEASNVPGPAGWIYAFKRRSGRPDACVYVWPDGRWELGLQTVPGAYLDVEARGRIEDGVLAGLPADVLRDADVLYQAGRISARLDGAPLPSSGN